MDKLSVFLQLFYLPVVTGCLISAVCAVLGVFVILKRVVFIGVTLSEVAACGVALGMLTGFPPPLFAALLTVGTVTALAQPYEIKCIPRDALMAVIFVAAGAASVLLVSKSGFGLHEVKMLLYGDLILASGADLAVIGATTVLTMFCLLFFLRPTLYTFLDRDMAAVLGINVRFWEMFFFAALGLVVSVSSKVGGFLLIFCYLTVPPAAGLVVSKRLHVVLSVAAGIGVISTVAGLFLAFLDDLPANQTIAAVCCVQFAACAVAAAVAGAWRRLYVIRQNRSL